MPRKKEEDDYDAALSSFRSDKSQSNKNKLRIAKRKLADARQAERVGKTRPSLSGDVKQIGG